MAHMWVDPEEMARRQDRDFIASLNMINEGGVDYEAFKADRQTEHTNTHGSHN